MQSLFGDIPAHKAAGPNYSIVECSIGTGHGLFNGVSAGGYVQHTPACRAKHTVIAAHRSCVKHLHPVLHVRRIRTFYGFAFGVGAGITLGGHHHIDHAIAVPFDRRCIRQFALGRQNHQLQQIRIHAAYQYLTFRIAEADIVFNQFRPVRGHHQSGEQHTRKGIALRCHTAHGRNQDFVHNAPLIVKSRPIKPWYW